jgi:hypothetical protein
MEWPNEKKGKRLTQTWVKTEVVYNLRKVWSYQRDNQKPYIEEGQTMQ